MGVRFGYDLTPSLGDKLVHAHFKAIGIYLTVHDDVPLIGQMRADQQVTDAQKPQGQSLENLYRAYFRPRYLCGGIAGEKPSPYGKTMVGQGVHIGPAP